MTDPPVKRPTLSALPDVELAALAATGGRQAFGELVRRHGSAVRALLRRMGADAATADDVAQDAFMIAYERIGELRGHGAVAGWIKRIAARLYIKRWRRTGRLEALETATSLDGDRDGEDGESQAADKLDLDDALRSLSPAERLCVSLCCGAGLTHAEAAEALKTPLGTVKSHVRRGLDKLKARLATHGGGPRVAAAPANPLSASGDHG